MNINKYIELPISLPAENLAIMFKEVLNEYNLNNINKSLFLDILEQLMDRQCYTYELLREDIRNNIDLALCKLWNTKSFDDVNVILSLVVNLGLEKCFEMAKESLNLDKNMDKRIIKEIEETIEEVGENIRNPFYVLDSKFKNKNF